MTHHAAQYDLRTDAFVEDFAHSARWLNVVLWGLLAIIGLCIVNGASDPDGIRSLAFFVFLFGFGTMKLCARAQKNQASLVIGPEGVSFPAAGIDTIPWNEVTRVRLYQINTRQMRVTALRFHFREGNIKRWQFGALGRNRWEIITSIETLLGTTRHITGGLDPMIDSISRFHTVER